MLNKKDDILGWRPQELQIIGQHFNAPVRRNQSMTAEWLPICPCLLDDRRTVYQERARTNPSVVCEPKSDEATVPDLRGHFFWSTTASCPPPKTLGTHQLLFQKKNALRFEVFCSSPCIKGRTSFKELRECIHEAAECYIMEVSLNFSKIQVECYHRYNNKELVYTTK